MLQTAVATHCAASALLAHDFDKAARKLQAVTLIADNPSDHHIFLGTLTDQRDLHSSSLGVAARTRGGQAAGQAQIGLGLALHQKAGRGHLQPGSEGLQGRQAGAQAAGPAGLLAQDDHR